MSGTRPKSVYKLSWHHQILIKIDLEELLVEEMDINGGEFNIKQKIIYKHLSNACFNCGSKDHYIRNCPHKRGGDGSPGTTDQNKEVTRKGKEAQSNKVIIHQEKQGEEVNEEKNKVNMSVIKLKSWHFSIVTN